MLLMLHSGWAWSHMVVVEGRWGIDVGSACEEHVGLDVEEVWAPSPDILPVVNDGHHGITTWEHRPGHVHV